MNGATQSLGCQQFGKGGIEVVRNEGGDDVLFSVGNNKEVPGTHGVPVVVPSWARKPTGLRSVRSWSGVLLVCSCVHSCNIKLVTALVENKGHVFDQTFILNSSLYWIVCCLDKGL